MTVRILFVGGSGRSGSTLLDRAIGQLPGFFSGGEILDIWRAGVGENRLCGCGRPFAECEVWQAVGQSAFGGWNAVDRVASEREVRSFGFAEGMRVVLSGRERMHDRFAARTEVLRRLYGAISEVTDGAWIIDSSKAPYYGLALSMVPDFDVRAIHIVRDSRAVAYSWAKHVQRPDTPGRVVMMHRLGATSVSARWDAYNWMMEALGRRMPVARLRYEAFLRDPRFQLERAMATLGLGDSAASMSHLETGMIRLGTDHTVMGNPMRMATGEIPLREDDEWRSQLPALPRAVVTAMTWPMLLRYGYRLLERSRLELQDDAKHEVRAGDADQAPAPPAGEGGQGAEGRHQARPGRAGAQIHRAVDE